MFRPTALAMILALLAPAASAIDGLPAILVNGDLALPADGALTDGRSTSPALGWEYRVASGQAPPQGSARWELGGLVRLVVDPDDRGAGTATLRQTLGQRDRACANGDIQTIAVDVADVEGAPVRVHALVAEPGRPDLVFSQAATAAPGAPDVLRLAMPPLRCAAVLLLAFESDASAEILLDGIAIEAGALDPRTNTGIGTLDEGPPQDFVAPSG